MQRSKLFLFAFGGMLTLLSTLSTSATRTPNIILIMTDDMGYECLGCNGGLDYQTPVLDRLAGQGLRFDHCYSQPICTPSRVKIMTGRYSFRNYERFGLLPTSEITFGTQLQKAGYRTDVAAFNDRLTIRAPAPRPDAATRTLEEQLAIAREKARKSGKPFVAERTTRWFHAKDLNHDGVLSELEIRTAAPANWNRQESP